MTRKVAQPEDRALAFSHAFLGVRLECAQCHKHPFDQWTQDDFKQFQAFFSPVAYGISPASRPQAVAERIGSVGLPHPACRDTVRSSPRLRRTSSPSGPLSWA